MPKAKAGAETEPEKKGRKDSVRPPADLPEGTPFERMAELTRRLLNVPKQEAAPPDPKRSRHA